jgi:hypothetical protein
MKPASGHALRRGHSPKTYQPNVIPPIALL